MRLTVNALGVFLCALVVLTGCAPRAIVTGEQLVPGMGSVLVVGQPDFYKNFVFKTRLTYNMTGGLRTDPEARELTRLFSEVFIAELTAAGFQVVAPGNFASGIDISVDLAHDSLVPLTPNAFASITRIRVNEKVLAEIYFGEYKGYVYGKRSIVRDVAKGAAKALIERLRAAG